MKTIEINIQQIQVIFDEHKQAFEQFENLLIEENRTHNLTRIVSPEQVRVRHFLDSLAAIAVMDKMSNTNNKPLSIIDLGSGAGFPSLALAIARPDWAFTSLEATEKKARFQQEVCNELKLNNVRVLHGRAEELAHNTNHRGRYDIVTARALAALPMLAELSLAFIRPGGHAIYWKGSQALDELNTAQFAIKQMKAKPENMYSYLLPTDDPAQPPFALIVCQKEQATPSEYPRSFGMIKRKPLANKQS